MGGASYINGVYSMCIALSRVVSWESDRDVYTFRDYKKRLFVVTPMAAGRGVATCEP